MTLRTLAPYPQRYEAHLRARRAKERMDAALVELESAEDEWHQACIECDRLDGVEHGETAMGGKE
jgi:hypothetical protein